MLGAAFSVTLGTTSEAAAFQPGCPDGTPTPDGCPDGAPDRGGSDDSGLPNVT
ncbi:hypothetical protein GCM10027610_127420 [Dactylosporangium cerinum]